MLFLDIYYCSLVGFLLCLRDRCKISVYFEPANSTSFLLFIELQKGILWAPTSLWFWSNCLFFCQPCSSNTCTKFCWDPCKGWLIWPKVRTEENFATLCRRFNAFECWTENMYCISSKIDTRLIYSAQWPSFKTSIH